MLDRILRVDHAGEYGANRIYAGQMAVLGRSSIGPLIQVGGLCVRVQSVCVSVCVCAECDTLFVEMHTLSTAVDSNDSKCQSVTCSLSQQSYQCGWFGEISTEG